MTVGLSGAAGRLTEIEFAVHQDHADALSDALLEHGALSVQVLDGEAGTAQERPVFGEPGLQAPPLGWRVSRLIVLAADEAAGRTAVRHALDALGLTDGLELLVRSVDEQDWVTLTQSQFQPIAIGARLWITPSWHRDRDEQAGRIRIELDPGMAFGTGSHPTTRLCLAWLDAHVRPGDSVIDYGCGSGILAIAAARLGATEVVGIDIDEQAVACARINARNNGVTARFAGSRERLPVAGDIVVANILANPLKLLAPMLQAIVRPGGHLLLAGLLDAQVDEVAACYALLPMHCAASEAGWSLLVGQRPGGDRSPMV